MKQYLEMLQHIKDHGFSKEDRTGTGTISVFGYQMRFNDIQSKFPLITTKYIHLKSVIHELLWFISGDTNIKYLNDNGVTIWNEWADQDGNLGPVYGMQWREWQGCAGDIHDQLAGVIERIKTNPDCRRLVVSAWNVDDLPDPTMSPQENALNGRMALAPCHVLFQFYVLNGRLSCHMYQRSADAFLGVPFNIASYALLTMMVAQVCDLVAGDLIISFGDLHIYRNHVEQVDLQVSRDPQPAPVMYLNPSIRDIDDFRYEDFFLSFYHHHPGIKAPIAV